MIQLAMLLLQPLFRVVVDLCLVALGQQLLKVYHGSRKLHLPSNLMKDKIPCYLVLIFLFMNFSGMAFGTGSAVAHRAVDAIMGPRTIQHEAVVSDVATAPAPAANTFGSDACNVHTKAFQDVCCLPHFYY